MKKLGWIFEVRMQERLKKLAHWESQAQENITKAIDQGNYKLQSFWTSMRLKFSDAQVELMKAESGF